MIEIICTILIALFSLFIIIKSIKNSSKGKCNCSSSCKNCSKTCGNILDKK
ncbi:FeoB-associated Cys-rich membrane protein [Clostridium botulinum]|uniref:FeoB-associated Cys-rich membrane protein n=1 Tax=Clostridium botulinum TaxID=1491 RepID=UPI0022463791|nr:FeoB-associated Cys-rich membrane protein [Clostridium botulinum]UZP02503.1 FeoB-associated Cys-rich membrane protein [Clostridium botulinum]UZP05862.1 FeoB-associated Cys-rich membrane protein [Clostridium botulinum]UZP09243.1 FeoB-associated Cys-rich membrane protein [Clostridium botulinum]